MRQYEYVGNVHVHTMNSDGSGTAGEIAEAAARAGLDFVAIADHNTLSSQLQGRYGQVYLLAGQEITPPSQDHLLVFGADRCLAEAGLDMQAIIDAARSAGAATFLAHPYEHAAAYPPEPPFPWRSWHVEGYTGLELWNYMSEFKGQLRSKARALLGAYAPSLAIDGPFWETVARWDELLRQREVPIVGSSDAHGQWYSLGPLRRQVFSYEHLFRCVNTHVLLDEPLPSDPSAAAVTIFAALSRGHAFVAYDAPASSRGFRLTLSSQGKVVASMGDSLAWSRGLVLTAQSPAGGYMRLLRDGNTIVSTRLAALAYALQQPGVYRVEVTRHFRGRRRAWIFSNPVYVR